MRIRRLRSQQGMATVEFSVIATMALLMAFIIVDFGALIQAQAVVTNVTREGASLASRDLKTGDDLMNLMQSATSPLEFQANPEKYKIFMVKVNAGDANAPNPTCSNSQTAKDNGYYSESGSLDNVPTGSGTYTGIYMSNPVDDPNCGLTPVLWNLLTYNDDVLVEAAPISQFTVVKVYWVHLPMTPLEGVLGIHGNGALNFDYSHEITGVYTGAQGETNDFKVDSLLVGSTAIF